MNEGFKNLRKGNQLNRLLAKAFKSTTNELTNQYFPLCTKLDKTKPRKLT